jgi:hypothetical protein
LLIGEDLALLTRFLFCGDFLHVVCVSHLSAVDAFLLMTVTSLGFSSKLEQFEISPSLISLEEKGIVMKLMQ